MSKRAIFSVSIDGADVTSAIAQYVISIRVSLKAGKSGDTATVELDDKEGQIVLPRPDALMTIMLGFQGESVSTVFVGKVDDVRSRRTRGQGQTVTVSAKGFDSLGKPKQSQQRHFDNKSIKDMLTEAGEQAGVTEIKVDDEFSSVVRSYEAMDDESFIAFGERLARELGGVFKVRDKTAVLTKMNSGTAPGGATLTPISAAAGVNLHTWDIAPFIGRPRFKKARARYYDQKEAKWKEVEVETSIEDAQPEMTTRFAEPDEGSAKGKTGKEKAESERNSGEGSITIEGNAMAQPEATCTISGARPGVDGEYRIDSVDHDLNRGSGFTTSLNLKQPQGSAGKDGRAKKKGSSSGDDDDNFSLPADPELG